MYVDPHQICDIWCRLNCKSRIEVKTLENIIFVDKKPDKTMYIVSFKFIGHVIDEINVRVAKYFCWPLGRQNSISFFHRFSKPVKKLFPSTFVNWRKYIFRGHRQKNMYDSVEVSLITYFCRFANKKTCFRRFTLYFYWFLADEKMACLFSERNETRSGNSLTSNPLFGYILVSVWDQWD
jgi:hypothetical protein